MYGRQKEQGTVIKIGRPRHYRSCADCPVPQQVVEETMKKSGCNLPQRAVIFILETLKVQDTPFGLWVTSRIDEVTGVEVSCICNPDTGSSPVTIYSRGFTGVTTDRAEGTSGGTFPASENKCLGKARNESRNWVVE